jgi:hypothetical protein
MTRMNNLNSSIGCAALHCIEVLNDDDTYHIVQRRKMRYNCLVSRTPGWRRVEGERDWYSSALDA